MCLKQNRKPLALKPGTSLAEKEAYSHGQFLPLHVQKPKKKKISRKQTSVDGVSSTLYNAVAQPLMSIEMSKAMLPALSSLNPKPQCVQLWNNLQNPEGVNTIFGTVPKGSVLSYQLAPLVAQDLHSHIIIPDIPPPPRFDFPNLPQTLLLVLPFEQHNIYSACASPQMKLFKLRKTLVYKVPVQNGFSFDVQDLLLQYLKECVVGEEILKVWPSD